MVSRNVKKAPNESVNRTPKCCAYWHPPLRFGINYVQRLAQHGRMLEIIGLSHSNVHHRQLLRHVLAQKVTSHGVVPDFIAVEYDPTHFAEIKRQRSVMRNLAEKEWPLFSAEVWDLMAMSLAFEVDCHLDVCPNVEIVWLDQGRDGSTEQIMQSRLEIYRGYVAQAAQSKTTSEVIAALDLGSRCNVFPPDIGIGERDQNWVAIIKQRFPFPHWAAAIVGANHTLEVGGSFRKLLQEARIPLSVTMLC